MNMFLTVETFAPSRKNPFGLYVTINKTADEAFGMLYWDDGESLISKNYL